MKKKTKIVFVVNPIAGRRKADNIEGLIVSNLNGNWDPIIIETKKSGHAGEIVLEQLSRGIVNFVAVGGDGTVSEVASVAFKAGANMGIIPCGSGNGLARTLGIPMKVDKAISVLNNGLLRKIDVGTLNSHYFFCTCGVGFDAKIGRKFAKQSTRGFRTYVRTTLMEFRNYKSKKYKLKIDGKKLSRQAFLVTIANAGQYGNNAYIAPKAKIDDGILDVCIFKPFPIHISIMLGIRLFTRNIDKSKYLEIKKGRTIEFRKDKKYSFHIDGDPVKIRGPVHIDVIPQALSVFVADK